jgi:XTP/dITP diphosphohydrolase
MKEITLVTGNKNKLEEYRHISPDLAFESAALDIPEIQSESLEEIAEHKAQAAFEVLRTPVVVEDVGFFLEYWDGMPGPFVKFFEMRDEKNHLIRLLQGANNRRGSAKVCIGYCDGAQTFTVAGEVHGTITHEVRNGDGFGFDFCFIPDGHDKTYSEMGIAEKARISHRFLAIKAFKEEYERRGL